ncbi:MAG: hypothetical protein GX572_03335 [Clostridia bacterium]|nr:hypothetical protein [Clostridia bacterium]
MDDRILVLSQLSQMASAILAGIFGGLAFDIYQKICYGSGKRRLKAIAYLKGDALFAVSLISAWLIFWFTCTDGSLRLFVFVWLALGFGLYFLALRKSLHLLLRQIIRLLRLARAMLRPAPGAQPKRPHRKRPPLTAEKLMDDSARLVVKLEHQAAGVSRSARTKLKAAAANAQHKSREQAAQMAKQSREQLHSLAQWKREKANWLRQKISNPWRRFFIRKRSEKERKEL